MSVERGLHRPVLEKSPSCRRQSMSITAFGQYILSQFFIHDKEETHDYPRHQMFGVPSPGENCLSTFLAVRFGPNEGVKAMVSIKILKEANIFKSLNDAQLDELASIAVSETHRAGTLLYKEGDPATHLYIVEEGKVFLQMETEMGSDRPPMQVTVDTINGGQAMGWSALVEPHKYTLSCLCMENSKLVSFEADKLRELLNQDSALGVEVMKGIVKLLASRLNNTRILLISEMAMAQLRRKGETLL